MDEKNWYLQYEKEKCFAIDNDRFKEKSFVFSPFPKTGLHGFQDGQVRSLILADIEARYLRLINENVLYPIGYHSLSLSSFLESKKTSNALDDEIQNVFKSQMQKLGIGINDQKHIDMRHHEYLSILQNAFIELYERGYIHYKMTNPYFDKDKNKIYDFITAPEGLPKTALKAFVLDIGGLIPQIVGDIDHLQIADAFKASLKQALSPSHVMNLELMLSNGSSLDISLREPEYMGGIAYIFLNPEFIDINEYISRDEYGSVTSFMMEGKDSYVYTGLTARNPLTGVDIPVFISYLYQAPYYLGNPSIDMEDKSFVESEGLSYPEILLGNILVHSDLLDGLEPLDARERIFEAFLEAEIATQSYVYENNEIVLSSLDPFGALFPFLEDKDEIYSLKEHLPYAFSSQFRPILGEDVDIPGSQISGTMSSLFTEGMCPFISMIYDEIGSVESLFSEETKEVYETWLPIKDTYLYEDNLKSSVLIPIIFYNIIKKEVGYTLPDFFSSIHVLPEALDMKHRAIHRSNNNLMDMDRLIQEYGCDAIRLSSALPKEEEEQIVDTYRLTDYQEFLYTIYKAIAFNQTEDNALDYYFRDFASNIKEDLEAGDISSYAERVVTFSKNLILKHSITKKQAIAYLSMIYPLCPYLAEHAYKKIFNGKYSILNEGWPY